MRLSETQYEDLVKLPLSWESFDEDPNSASDMKDLLEKDPDATRKIDFLKQVDEGNLLDRATFRKLDFYEIEFNELARLYVAEGEFEADDKTKNGSFDYLKDYSGIRLLIQDVTGPAMDEGTFAIYIKDYEFGYITPLGLCIYPFAFDETSLRLYKKDRKAFILKYLLVHLEAEFWNDDFDLKKELFDYYHNLPDVHNPLIEDRMDANSLLSATAASHLLGISIPRVMKMVEEKSIDGYRFAGKLLITKASVEKRLRYIAEHNGDKPTRGKALKPKPKKRK